MFRERVPLKLVYKFGLVLMLLGGLYVWTNQQVFSGFALASRPSALGGDSLSGNVSNQSMQQIVQSVGGIDGLEDLTVLPDSGGAVEVTADLQISDFKGGELTDDEIRNVVNAYFGRLFALSTTVRQAEITFLDEDQIVGGAGLDKKTFQQLTARTSGRESLSDLLGALTSLDSTNVWLSLPDESENNTAPA